MSSFSLILDSSSFKSSLTKHNHNSNLDYMSLEFSIFNLQNRNLMFRLFELL